MAMPYAIIGAATYPNQAVTSEVTNNLLDEALMLDKAPLLLDEALANASAFHADGQSDSFGQMVAPGGTWLNDLLVTSTNLYDAEPQVDNPRKRQRADAPVPPHLQEETRLTYMFSQVASSNKCEGSMRNEAEPSRGRSTSKTVPSRSGSASSFASNVSCGSCSATFARPDVRKRHEDEKHFWTARKVTCGGAWLGWGCGKEYANERSLKDHWSREAKDGTGRSCKAAKESVFASFPPKDDLTSRSSSQDAFTWDEHENMDKGSTTPAQPSTLLPTSIQPIQTKVSNISPRDDRPWAALELEVAKMELQRAIPSLRNSYRTTLAVMKGSVAYIKEIEAEKATLEQRLETEINSLQERIDELNLENMLLQSGLNTQDLTISNLG